MNLEGATEDMVEVVKPFEDKEVSVENDNIGEATEAFIKLATLLGNMQQLLEHEIEMNRVASKEVKCFAFLGGGFFTKLL